jgi:hypothetical protein
MIRTTTLLLMAALGLITSAIAAQPANSNNIQITYLPFNITAPGTYVLTGNLTYTGTDTAITITSNLTGPVVLNLRGHTLTGSGGNNFTTENFSNGVSVSGNGPSPSTITIENGTITNFGFGVRAQPTNGIVNGLHAIFFSAIDINNLVFAHTQTPAGDGAGVLFSQVNSSTVSNCTFGAADFGIEDVESAGGNRYTNDIFTGAGQSLVVYGLQGAANLEDCHFAAPANP